jgi:hypothetical protein
MARSPAEDETTEGTTAQGVLDGRKQNVRIRTVPAAALDNDTGNDAGRLLGCLFRPFCFLPQPMLMLP